MRTAGDKYVIVPGVCPSNLSRQEVWGWGHVAENFLPPVSAPQTGKKGTGLRLLSLELSKRAVRTSYTAQKNLDLLLLPAEHQKRRNWGKSKWGFPLNPFLLLKITLDRGTKTDLGFLAIVS